MLGRPLQRCSLSMTSWLALLVAFALVLPSAAYRVAVSDEDQLRQTCSGMWSGKDTKIDLTFAKNSSGAVATIFYEWADFPKLGKPGPDKDVFGDALKTFICTPQAVNQKVCDKSELGNFLVDGQASTVQRKRVDLNGSSKQDLTLTYAVNQTGYYCVGASAVPLTANNEHAAFQGDIVFHNAFKGELPGGEFPKLGFYFGLTCLYVLLGLGWGYLCVRHKDELLLVQHFVSGIFVLLIVEQLITWAYYSYLNSHAIDFWRLASVDGHASETWSVRALLVVESILDATRNSASFFLLVIVSMGYGVVRPSIDPRLMLRVKLLSGVHLVCGCLYSVGIVLLSIDAGGSWVFLFIFPLAFTLTALMMWSLNSLNATIAYLGSRKQLFKLSYFLRLYRILIGAVVVIFLFFIASSLAFSQSGGENFPSKTWRYRWFLLDGWTSTLYLGVFAGIAWIWRPTGSNLRLSMSDEVATGEGDVDDAMEMGGQFAGGPAHPDDEDDEDDEDAAKRKQTTEPRAAAPRSSASASGAPPAYNANAGRENSSELVFSLGEDDDDDSTMSPPRAQRARASRGGDEGEGLMPAGNASEETLTAGGRNRTTKQD